VAEKPKQLPDAFVDAEVVEKEYRIGDRALLRYGRFESNVSITETFVTHFTPETATALVAIEQAKADAERYRAEAAIRVAEQETRQREAAARQGEREAEERTKQEQEATKQEQETTLQAQEGTAQSGHKLWRVVSASAVSVVGVIGCVLAPAAAASIGGFLGTVLVVAVGGSYAVEAINNKRRNPGLPPKADTENKKGG
jgi:hypothetical protein